MTTFTRHPVIAMPIGESKVEQAHRDRVNINSIVRKYMKTGLLPQRGNPGFYGDFESVPDFQSCINRVKEAEENFMTLPSEVRKRFSNNPVELFAFLDNEANREEAENLGIIPRREPDIVEPENPVEPEP